MKSWEEINPASNILIYFLLICIRRRHAYQIKTSNQHTTKHTGKHGTEWVQLEMIQCNELSDCMLKHACNACECVYSLHVQTTLSIKESIAAEQMTLPVVDKPVSKRLIKSKKQEIQYIPSLLMYRVLITDIIR